VKNKAPANNTGALEIKDAATNNIIVGGREKSRQPSEMAALKG
jgi:hypothetical protein